MKWLGDEFNLMRDVFHRMSDQEALMLQAQTGMPLFNEEEIRYMSGGKMNLIRAVAKMTAINRLMRMDEKKYMTLFKNRKLVIDYDKLMIDSMKPKADHMFQ